MSRADEIAQGLRDETGALIGGLDVLDYLQAHRDHDAGVDRPRISSASYDLGRARASEIAEKKVDLLAKIEAESEATRQRVRGLLKDHPGILADYDRQMATIDTRKA